MLICILGLSACGKDYVTKIISHKYKLNKIVQFTTRPMRTNEINGIDYYFIDEESFKELINEDAFISYRVFPSSLGKWHYGIKKDSLSILKNNIICIDIEGLDELLRKLNSKEIVSIFIEADYNIRRCRAEKRSNFDINEFERRYMDDINKVDTIKRNCNYIIDNNSSSNEGIEKLYTILDMIL